MPKPKNKLTWLILILIFTSISFSDYHRANEIQNIIKSDKFSIIKWEIRHLPLKWSHLLWELFPGNTPSDSERIQIVDEYLKLARQVNKEETLIDKGLKTPKYPPNHPSSALSGLIHKKEKLRAKAEESIEANLSFIAHKQNLGLPFGILFPPVDIRLDTPPHILITSPRDEIKVTNKQLIQSNINGHKKQEIENKTEETLNVSALIDNISGLGTYPALVSDQHDLRQIFRTAAHEWLHNYWFFKPLGQQMWNSTEMYTLNETAADIAGDELGDLAFLNFGGDLSDPGNKYLTNTNYENQLYTILRETRKTTEILLNKGKISEAENYMKSQWWLLKLSGYNIRKINQAFFAFRGSYATGPASISPIGNELMEYRTFFPNPGSFIKQIAKVKDYDQFKEELSRMRLLSTSNHSVPD